MFKKIIALVILSISLVGIYAPTSADTISDWWKNSSSSSAGSARVSRSDLLVGGGENSANASTSVTIKDNFLRSMQVYMIGLLGIVSVSVFLYIGYMLFTAQGKEEDFKKGWKALTYVAIGLAVIPLSYIVVKIVTGFTL